MKELLCALVLIFVCLANVGDAQTNSNRRFRTTIRNGQVIHIVDNGSRRTSNTRQTINYVRRTTTTRRTTSTFTNTRRTTNTNGRRTNTNTRTTNRNQIILGTGSGGQQQISIPRTSNIVAIIIRNPDISRTMVDLANNIMARLRNLDDRFLRAGVDRNDVGTTRAMKTAFTATKAKSKEMGEEERAKTAMIKEVSEQTNMSPRDVADSLDELMEDMGVHIEGLTTIDDNCDQFVQTQCDRFSKYRTADGSCNNLRKPLWGRAFIPFRRFLQPEYDDQVSSPRTLGKNGAPLPSAREVSLRVHETGRPNNDMRKTTHALMQWGQFLDHDFTSTPIASGSEHSQVGCCSDELSQEALNSLEMDPEARDICFPIRIPRGDPQFGHTSCMNFVRSIRVSNTNCNTRPFEQMNQITAYIDGSVVYGSSINETASLREFEGGLLKSSDNNLLPRDDQPTCLLTKSSDFCFKAGDARANEQMGLASMHTIWMREHNRMARELGQLNPTWDDETIFQETRRIVGAKIQHITYDEFLNIVMHQQHRRQYNVKPTNNNHARGETYDETVDASIRNAFATAAYRFGHSLVRTAFSDLGRGYERRGDFPLVSSFGNVSHVFEDGGEGINRYIRGLVTDKARSSDRFLTPMVTQRLFDDGRGHSLDLAALNIQRGRDHGLPGYNAWRRWCKLPVAKTFDDLVDHSKQTINIFRDLYDHVDDIDLFAGGVSENTLKGATVGATFVCILGHQFKALKEGDRFYYERKNGVTGFTRDQIRAIKQTTLAKVFCDNTDIEEMQPSAFAIVADNNARVSCDKLKQAPLTAWALNPPTPPPPTPRQAVTPEWSQWGEFGDCVNRKRSRTRVCVTSGNTLQTCVGPSTDTEMCEDTGSNCNKSIYRTWAQYLCK